MKVFTRKAAWRRHDTVVETRSPESVTWVSAVDNPLAQPFGSTDGVAKLFALAKFRAQEGSHEIDVIVLLLGPGPNRGQPFG